MVRKTICPVRKMSVAEMDAYLRERAHDSIAAALNPRGLRDQMPDVFRELAARTGITAARIASYFHGKIERPYGSEVALLEVAAAEAKARRDAIAELESEIQRRTEKLKGDHLRLVSDHPILGRLVPRPESAAEAGEAAPQAVKRRRAGGSRG